MSSPEDLHPEVVIVRGEPATRVGEIEVPSNDAYWNSIFTNIVNLSRLQQKPVQDLALDIRGHVLGRVPASADFFPLNPNVNKEPLHVLINWQTTRYKGFLLAMAVWNAGVPSIIPSGEIPKIETQPNPFLDLVNKGIEIRLESGHLRSL